MKSQDCQTNTFEIISLGSYLPHLCKSTEPHVMTPKSSKDPIPAYLLT